MRRSTITKWGDIKVGLVLVAGIAAMLWASLSGGGTSIFDTKDTFVCYFENVNGLVGGSPVWMSGVEVGNVKSVSFVNLGPGREVKVVCRVKKSVWHMLTDSSEVLLGTIGFLGDKYVEILPTAYTGKIIEPNDVIRTRDAGSVEAVMKTGEEAIVKAGSLITNLDSLLGRMNRGDGSLGKLATDDALHNNLTKLLANLTELTARLHANQERIVTSIETTAGAVSELTDKVHNNTGTLGKIVNDPALYDNLSATSAKLDSVMQRINAAEGSLGLFVSDTAFYIETVNLLTRVNNLVADIEQNPRRYFKFSVF